MTPGYPAPSPLELLSGEIQSFRSSMDMNKKLGFDGVAAIPLPKAGIASEPPTALSNFLRSIVKFSIPHTLAIFCDHGACSWRSDHHDGGRRSHHNAYDLSPCMDRILRLRKSKLVNKK